MGGIGIEMQRIIKFRAWDSFRKEMLYDAVTFEQREGYIGVNVINPVTGKRTDYMQYTGLLDSCGKEIYEGDIVKHNYGFGHGKGAVEYIPPEFMLTDENGDLCSELLGRTIAEIEVIGNIYKNPELLK